MILHYFKLKQFVPHFYLANRLVFFEIIQIWFYRNIFWVNFRFATQTFQSASWNIFFFNEIENLLISFCIFSIKKFDKHEKVEYLPSFFNILLWGNLFLSKVERLGGLEKKQFANFTFNLRFQPKNKTNWCMLKSFHTMRFRLLVFWT